MIDAASAAQGAVEAAVRLSDLFAFDRSRIEGVTGRRAGSVLRVHEALKARPLRSITDPAATTGSSFSAAAVALDAPGYATVRACGRITVRNAIRSLRDRALEVARRAGPGAGGGAGRRGAPAPGALTPVAAAGFVAAAGPDEYAGFSYDRIEALTNVRSYAHRPAMTFECGEDDDHVPADGALRFQRALADLCGELQARVRVNLDPGVGHGTVPAIFEHALRPERGSLQGATFGYPCA